MNQIPEKAYKNLEFLNSPPARHIRILCEYEETRQRLLHHRIHDTVVFFGSARARPSEEAEALLEQARSAANEAASDETAIALRRAEASVRMGRYYDDARELSKRITAWSLALTHGRSYVICSGGGPGIMEAANRGASDVEGGCSIGLGISLPFEQGVNKYVTPELAFEFHYFFTRKYWFLYLCKALVIFPGGFGTMDELFETLTLVQTGKIKKTLPIVLFGTDYWSRVLDLNVMSEFGTISPEDLGLVYRTDSVDDAYRYLTTQLQGSADSGLKG
ncbi:MAG TPA: LOG family protein [Deltaproteobacteria bacterium]|nr:LOG family protein [Deltaproteobacteria bacterium]